MQDDTINEHLADYLGGELHGASRQAFEQAMRGDPRLAAEAASLERALAALRSLDETGPAAPSRAPARAPAPMRALLRYAAAIAVAFGAGLLARPAITAGPAAAPPARSAMDDWQQRFAEAYVEHPAQSSLGRSIIALTRAANR